MYKAYSVYLEMWENSINNNKTSAILFRKWRVWLAGFFTSFLNKNFYFSCVVTFHIFLTPPSPPIILCFWIRVERKKLNSNTFSLFGERQIWEKFVLRWCFIIKINAQNVLTALFFIYVPWDRFRIFSMLFYSINTWGENVHIVSCGAGLHDSMPVLEPLLYPQGTEQTNQGSAVVNKWKPNCFSL